MRAGNFFKIFLRTLLVVFVIGYVLIFVVLNSPGVQQRILRGVESDLREFLDTELSVGAIEMRIPNKLTLTDVCVLDRDGGELLEAGRVSCHVDLLSSLGNKRVIINTLQIIRADISLRRDSAGGELNAQFLVDKFASENQEEKPFDLHLRFNSLIINRSKVSYDVESVPQTPGKFNPSHMAADSLFTTISLKAFGRDTVNARVRHLGFNEKSGFRLRDLRGNFVLGAHYAQMPSLQMKLPSSEINVTGMKASYDSVADLLSFSPSLDFDCRLNMRVVPSDLSSFVPAFAGEHEPVVLSAALTDRGGRLACSELDMAWGDDISIAGDCTFSMRGGEDEASASLLRAFFSRRAVDFLSENFVGRSLPGLENLEFVDFEGFFHRKDGRIDYEGRVKTDAGDLDSSLRMVADGGRMVCSGRLESDSLNLGRLTGEGLLGLCSFGLDVESVMCDSLILGSKLGGVIARIDVNGHTYRNITLGGEFDTRVASGSVSLDDDFLAFDVDGSFDLLSRRLEALASVRHFVPDSLGMTNIYGGGSLAFDVSADLTCPRGGDIGGRLALLDLSLMKQKQKVYALDSLVLTAQGEGGRTRSLSVEAPFVHSSVRGDFSYADIMALLENAASRHIPSLFGVKRPPVGSVDFDINVADSEFLRSMLGLKLKLARPVSIKGHADGGRVETEGSFPELVWRGKVYDSGYVRLLSNESGLSARAVCNVVMKGGRAFSLSVAGDAAADSLHTVVNWGNNEEVTYHAHMDLGTRFSRSPSGRTRADISILPAEVILKDSLWQVTPSHIRVGDGMMSVHGFAIENDRQYLRVDGEFSSLAKDSCVCEMKELDLAYILDLVDFDDVAFGGVVSGRAILGREKGVPGMDVRLDVKDFSVNSAVLGRGDIRGRWDDNSGGIYVTADIPDSVSSGRTVVDGFIGIRDRDLDLKILAQGTNLGLLCPYVRSVFSGFSGRAYGGMIRLFGPFKGLDLEGMARVDADMFVGVLGTGFSLRNQLVSLSPGRINFDRLVISDEEGHEGMVTGALVHDKLKSMEYSLEVSGRNLKFYDMGRSADLDFYGTVYADGTVNIDGGNNELYVDANVQTGRSTSFTYIVDQVTEAMNSNFITFRDLTPRPERYRKKVDFFHADDLEVAAPVDEPRLDIHMALNVACTPDAVFRVMMDPLSGDYISAAGSGDMHINWYNKGDFNIFGTYIVDHGFYKLSMQEVIRKHFNLARGGSIRFEGNPGNALIDVSASYSIPSVSLVDLGLAGQMRNSVRVNCLINMSGYLSDPSLGFDISLPDASEEVREMIRSITSSEEQMNTQIIYLLGIGKFYPLNYLGVESRESNATSSLAMSTLSGQLNNILSQWTEGKNWNFGANLSSGESGWSDMGAEAVLSGRLLDNRLLVNGNFGYRDNTVNDNHFVGDFEAVLLLDKAGRWRLRGYNTTNDKYFYKSALTTQGIGILYHKDLMNWSDLWGIFRRKKNNIK